MASYIDCVVDTNPMAQEISTVSNHIKGTTTAVVAMQTAVVLAEQKAADHVCDNVNKGFYTLIRSQISQKIAKLQSEVDSHLMHLNQQRKQLLSVKSRMERDYNMISGRYLKLFNGLNQNLKQRVLELDKPTIDFAVKEVEKVSNRTKYLAATVPVSQLESLAASQKIIASNVKFRGLKLINSMSNFLADMSEQKKLTDRILLEKGNAVENSTLFIPVLISGCNFDKYGNENIDVAVNNVQLSQQAQAVVKNAVNHHIENLQWQLAKEIDKEVRNEFSKLLSSANTSQRVKEMADKLFMANCFQTIKNGQL
jgi:predicted DNA-binding protein